MFYVSFKQLCRNTYTMYYMYPLSNLGGIHIQSVQCILSATQEEYISKVFNVSSQQLKRNTYTKVFYVSSQQLKRNTYTKCFMYLLSNSRGIHKQSVLCILSATQEEYIYKVFNAFSHQLWGNTYTMCSMYPLSNLGGLLTKCVRCILSAT